MTQDDPKGARKRAKRGAPKKGADEARVRQVTLRLTQGEYDELEEFSKLRLSSKADVIRRVLQGKKLQEPVSAQNIKAWRELGQVGANLNECVGRLYALTRTLEQLQAREEHRDLELPSVVEIEGLAQESAARVEQMMPVIEELRATFLGGAPAHRGRSK